MIHGMTIKTSPRRLHLIDIENLVGDGRISGLLAGRCRSAYRELGLVARDDLIVVGCNPFVGVDVGLVWRENRLIVGHGPDGADRALLRVLETERVEDRFTEVVLGSGDGIFVEQVVRMQHHDLDVTVVARPESLSKRLRLAAHRVLDFSLDPVPGAPAVARVAA